MFSPDRRCVVVVGAQWGDEGKGKVVDVLAGQTDLMVRYQGGANAGHTVLRDDRQFILHQIPTGILQPAVTCVIGNGVVLDPETLAAELEELESAGIGTEGRLLVSDRAHLLLRYHKAVERAAERRQQIGTTGRGIGPAYEDKVGRRGLRVGDLRAPQRVAEIVRRQVESANALLAEADVGERLDADEQLGLLEEMAPALLQRAVDAGQVVSDALRAGKRVLLEGAQGALLDVDHGTYPFVTSSNTTAGGAAVGAGIGPTAIDAVLGVMKAYTTRVGNGPFPSEASELEAAELRRIGAEFGATTGRPRRCGWFDAAVARYAVRVNGITEIALTKLDVLDACATIPVCTGYRLDGAEVESFPADAGTLGRVEPILTGIEGWGVPVAAARRMADLPPNARRYIEHLERLLETPIRYVSVGPRPDQTIEVA